MRAVTVGVANVPQSDFVGLHSGWGSRSEVKRDHRNWFHVWLPVLQRFDESPAKLHAVSVELEVAVSAVVEEIHIWSGGTQLRPLFSPIAVTGDFRGSYSAGGEGWW